MRYLGLDQGLTGARDEISRYQSLTEGRDEISYSETHNNEYIEKIHQMSYSSLSDNGLFLKFSFLIKWLHGTL